MKQTSLMRRLIAGAAGLVVGAAGAVALATPASATFGWKGDAKAEGSVECVDGEYVVDWKVKNSASARWGQAEVVYINSDVDGIANGDTIARGEWRHGTQTFHGTEQGLENLTVKLKWERTVGIIFRHTVTKYAFASANVKLDGSCKPQLPDAPDTALDMRFDCETAVVNVGNHSEYPWTYTVVTNEGDEKVIDLAAGESTSVNFPASEGLTVNVLIDDQSVVDAPVSITEGAWAEMGCAPPDPDVNAVVAYDCETISVTVENITEAEWTYSIVPSEGETVEVPLAPGEAAEAVEFDAVEGFEVDVQVDGESVLQGGPFVLTDDLWAELDCGGEGGGEELPVTGADTALIAGIALALLAAGGAVFFVARKRRMVFTA